MNLIDSNIWCYYFDKTLPEHKYVTNFIERIIHEQKVAITNIILLEVLHFLFKRLGAEKGYDKANVFQRGNFQIIGFTSNDFNKQIELMKEHAHKGLGSRDISIVVCMEKVGCKNLITHDKSFQNIGTINMIDPIADSEISS